ncbi:MAG TPA: hypothetical protein VMM79_13910 [Longimicrobiales bacterium]|nr:hypothetical protein [Longimicrobiales bacterium]
MMVRSVPWRLAIAGLLVVAGAACGESRDLPDDVLTRPPPQAVIPEPIGGPTDTEPTAARAPASSEFGLLIDRLSEEGGYFPSDNLVSNETSYLHVLAVLADTGVRGGAYLGVGPDQNFSYIAEIRPDVAFIIDIRRDNLLHHLLFKALFANARNRIDYLCLMLGKPVPENLEEWTAASIDEIVVYVDTARTTLDAFEAASGKLLATVRSFGVSLSAADLGTIRGIHTMFFDYGLDIRYSNRSRGGMGRFPSWRRLLVETDLEGVQRGYLSDEAKFRWLKEFQQSNRLIPVVGDLAGPHALAAIGRDVDSRGLDISAFYVSNVEQYLMQGPEFERFAATVARLPIAKHAVIIRSYFARRTPIPQRVPGHLSTQLLERMDAFVETWNEGGYFTYLDLVTRNAIPLQPAPAGEIAREYSIR